jgi:hypothetical protein
MWNEDKQRKFDELRRREFEETLTEAERRHLAQLLDELDREEWERLRPTIEKYQREQEAAQEKLDSTRLENAALEAIISKQEALLARVREQLALFRNEYQSLQAEYERATGQRLGDS